MEARSKKFLIGFVLLLTVLFGWAGFEFFSTPERTLSIENPASQASQVVAKSLPDQNPPATLEDELPNKDPEEINQTEETEKKTESKQSDQNSEEDTDKEEEQEKQKEIETVAKSEDNSKSNFDIKRRLVDWGFSVANSRKIDTIIIHSSYDALGDEPYSTSGLIDEYEQYGVAPHYLINRDGDVYLLVAEKNIAYHAGKSQVPDGRTSVNNFSIGIEMMNTKTDSYTKNQYASLNKLLKDIKSRYKIKYTLGHDDIAPERKTDPWNFNWDKID